MVQKELPVGRRAPKFERIGEKRIERESGYLYFLGKDGYFWRTPKTMNTTGVEERIGHEKIKRADGYMYFLDKYGYVTRARIRYDDADGASRAKKLKRT